MKSNPLAEAGAVFNTLERWTAFYEIECQIGTITEHWLTVGAKALREHFTKRESSVWQCDKWGVDRDTRWYLKGEPEANTINLGIGWPEFELHLFHSGADPAIRSQAQRMLETDRFEALRILVGSTSSTSPATRRRQDGSIFSDLDFNPFGEVGDSKLRARIIAWHAMHRTPEFVEKTAAKICQISENQEVVALIRELNQLCQKPVKGR